MSILGAVVRVLPQHLDAVSARAGALPGVDVALNPGDGRLVLVIEDTIVGSAIHGAAAVLATMAQWPEVLNTSLVYEYSGPDAPPLDDAELGDYGTWRGGPGKQADTTLS